MDHGGTQKYYDPNNKLVQDGDVAYASDLNDINYAVDSSFEQVAEDLDSLEGVVNEVVGTAREWATNDQGDLPDALYPGKYSSQANALESKEWASNATGAPIHLADGTTSSEKSAKANAQDSLVYANSASASANSASSSASDSQNSADASAASAAAALASETAAGLSEAAAAASELAASISEGNASASEQLAYRWANELEDVIVSGGEYSAYHWATKAAASAASFTPDSLLADLLTVDGSGSNLDADLLDGVDSTQFLRSDVNDTVTSDTTWGYSNSAQFGTSQGIRIFHEGTYGYIGNSTGDFLIRNDTLGNDISLQAQTTTGTKVCVRVVSDGTDAYTRLYHNGVTRLETTSNGLYSYYPFYTSSPTSLQNSTTGYGCVVGQRYFVGVNEDDISGLFRRNGTEGEIIVFRYNKYGNVGSISVSSSGTAYNTTSDYRLKNGIKEITDGIDRVKALRPVRHKWVADQDAPEIDGFLAHEVQEAGCEYAVTGEKDGKEIQNMDYGRITPVIVAAVKDVIDELGCIKDDLKCMKSIIDGLCVNK